MNRRRIRCRPGRARRTLVQMFLLLGGSRKLTGQNYRPSFSGLMHPYTMAQLTMLRWIRLARVAFITSVVVALGSAAGTIVYLCTIYSPAVVLMVAFVPFPILWFLVLPAACDEHCGIAPTPLRKTAAQQLWISALWRALPQMTAAEVCTPELLELVGHTWLREHGIDSEAFIALGAASAQPVEQVASATKLLAASEFSSCG